MREFRRKQRRLYKIMKTFVIIGAVYIFIYIGVQPYLASVSNTVSMVCNYVSDFLVVAILVLLFLYYSKYGKSDSFLTSIENEISDVGYYFTARQVREQAEYKNAIVDDLRQCGFSINNNIVINDFEFDFRGVKKKEYFYCALVDNIDRNDILAYLDCVIYDITIKNLKRQGNAVLCFITDNAEDDAIALSKMITPLGKKEKIKIAISICELSTGRVYFLGNEKSKCQQMIANYVMNCDLPIKEQYIGKERLPFQDELEERMKSFNIKDFKDGNFYAH
jgi:hypothetical protein